MIWFGDYSTIFPRLRTSLPAAGIRNNVARTVLAQQFQTSSEAALGPRIPARTEPVTLYPAGVLPYPGLFLSAGGRRRLGVSSPAGQGKFDAC